MPDATLVGESRGTESKRVEREPRSISEVESFDAAALAEKLRSEADRFLRARPPEADPPAFRL